MNVRRVPVGVLLLTILTAELAVLYVVFRNGSWVYDDHFYLLLAKQHGFNLGWLGTPIYQHWGLGANAVVSGQLELFPFDYRWALIAMLVVLGGSVYLFERALAMVVAQGWITLSLAAWFGLSVLWTRPLQWWTFGLQTFPIVFFDLLCLYGFLRYHAEHRDRWIAVSAGALAAGLLFYEKPAFMLLYLALVRILFMSDAVRPRAIIADFWRERRLWIPYLVVVGVWGVGYFSRSVFGPSAGHVSLGQYADYFRILWLYTLVPALAGLSVPGSGLGALQIAGVAAGQVLVITCIVASVRGNRNAWRAWLFLAIVVVVTGILVARQRIAQFGVGIGGDLRYLIDFSWLVPLAISFIVSRQPTVWPVVRPRPSLGELKAPRKSLLVVGVLLAAYAVVSVATADRLERGWPALQARQWDQNLSRGLSALQRARERPVIADAEVAPEIMEAFNDPYSRLSSVLPIYRPGVQVDGPLNGPLYTLDQGGNPHRASMVGVPRMGGTHPARRCIATGSGSGSVQWHWANALSAASGPYFLLLRYTVPRRVRLPLFVDAAGAPGPIPVGSMALAPEARESIGWLVLGSPRGIRISLPPGTIACLGPIRVVTLHNLDGSPYASG